MGGHNLTFPVGMIRSVPSPVFAVPRTTMVVCDELSRVGQLPIFQASGAFVHRDNLTIFCASCFASLLLVKWSRSRCSKARAPSLLRCLVGWLLKKAAETGCWGWLLRKAALRKVISSWNFVFFVWGGSGATTRATCISSFYDRWCPKTVAKPKFRSSPEQPFHHFAVDAQNCGETQSVNFAEQPFRHFAVVGRPKLWRNISCQLRQQPFCNFVVVGRPKQS